MANLTIQLDAEALREATMQAVMGLLTPEAKEQMIKSAITEVLKAQTSNRFDSRSFLQAAFDQAVQGVTNTIAIEMVKNDAGLQEKIAQLLKSTTEKVLKLDQDKLATRMGEALVNSMRRD